MPAWYWIVIVALFGSPFLYKFVRLWIVTPIRMHRRQSLAALPTLQHATPEHITPELSDMLRSVLPRFRAEGFESAAMTFGAHNVPNVRSVSAILVNRATQDVAMIRCTWGKAIRSIGYSIHSEFTDGTGVTTGVNPGIGVFPRDPGVNSVIFSRLPDIHALCEFHRRRLRHLGVDQRPRHPIPPGTEIDRTLREWQRNTARLVSLGYMYLESSGQRFRYTWKGAFLSTWRLIQPIKGWRIKLRDRRALALWRKLQMPDHPADPATPPPHADATPTVAPAPIASQTVASPPVASEPSTVNYEVNPAEGEIVFDPTADGLTLRIGRATVAQFFARNWLFLVWILLCTCIIAFNLVTNGLARLLVPGAGAPATRWVLPATFFVLACFAAWRLARVARTVICLRGTTVLTANRHGLTYRNVPTPRGSGHIAREDLRGLLVVSPRRGRHKFHVLCALRHNARALPLLVSPDAQQADRARVALARSLGIETSEPITLT
jgi:hypothetical protein